MGHSVTIAQRNATIEMIGVHFAAPDKRDERRKPGSYETETLAGRESEPKPRGILAEKKGMGAVLDE